MSRERILNEVQAASPQYPQQLDEDQVRALQFYTEQLLLSESDEAAAAYDRFVPQDDKGLPFDEDAMTDHINGKRILITGGNGCIGSVLSAELSKFEPALIATVGTTAVTANAQRGHIRSEYADIRDKGALRYKFDAIRPDVVYHLAGQRNVGAAEKGLWSTLETNILGTQNVVDLAQCYGVSSLVYASSEKALPPYVADAYSVSKKASEWLLSNVVEPHSTTFSIARLAHIADNSVIFNLMRQWAEQSSPIKLFGVDTSFHTQTALGAAHTLMVSGLDADASLTKLFAVRELGEPVSLVNLALGVIATTGSQSPIYFSPSAPGYEPVNLPPVFKHVDNPTVIPLVGQFELARVEKSAVCSEVAVIPNLTTDEGRVSEVIARLSTSRGADTVELKSHLSWALLSSTLGTLNNNLLKQALAYYETLPTALSNPDKRIVGAIRNALETR